MLRRAVATTVLTALATATLAAPASATEPLPTRLALPLVSVPAPTGADYSEVPRWTRINHLAAGGDISRALADAATMRLPVTLELFGDVRVTAVGAFTSTLTDGTRTWNGHSPDSHESTDDVVLVVQPNAVTGGDEIVNGNVWQDGVAYALQRVAPGVVAVAEVAPDAVVADHVHHPTPDPTTYQPPQGDSTLIPELAPPPNMIYGDAEAVAQSSDEATAGSDAYVDVLVVYSPTAGSRTNISARVSELMYVANQANANDGLSFRFRAIRIMPISLNETRTYAQGDLETVRLSSTVAQMRTSYGADIVAFAGWGYGSTKQTQGAHLNKVVCGLAYTPTSFSKTSWSAFTYSLWDVDRNTCGDTVAAHEMGHNLTLQHDWTNDETHGDGSPYTPAYNHGWNVLATNGFRTVMAYSPAGCTATSPYHCPSIPYWSNPNATYNGHARGSALTSATPAWDAKALSIAAPQIAKWFQPMNPFGTFEEVGKYPNGVRVTGWAIDPDTRDPINVQVYVDGVHAKTFGAYLRRDDVYATYQGYGPNHGFSFAVLMGGGTHSICVHVPNVRGGTVAYTDLGCKTFTVPVNPVGGLSRSYTRIPGGARFTGWALDPDTASAITAQVQVDGVTVSSATANLSSPTPSAGWQDWGTSHGFSMNVPMSSGVAHEVCLLGVNVDEGVTTRVDCFTVTLNSSPFGGLERVLRRPGGIRVDGWAIDPDTADPIYVRVTVDGTLVRTELATLYQTGLGGYPDYGSYHGFSAEVGELTDGSHTICAQAVNVSAGTSTTLGCRSIVYTHDPTGAVVNITRNAANVVEITGWAIDPDTYGATTIRVSVGDATGGGGRELMGPPVTADKFTYAPGSDWTDIYGYNHGFTTQTVVGLGPQTVCIQADNIGTGTGRVIGCYNV